MTDGDDDNDADEGGVGGEEAICGIISNPCKSYSSTFAFEQVINDGEW